MNFMTKGRVNRMRSFVHDDSRNRNLLSNGIRRCLNLKLPTSIKKGPKMKCIEGAQFPNDVIILQIDFESITAPTIFSHSDNICLKLHSKNGRHTEK